MIPGRCYLSCGAWPARPIINRVEPEAGGLNIGIIGAPVDLGQQRRGVDMGPSAIRIANLEARLEALGHKVKDYGNVPVADMATAHMGDRKVRYLVHGVRQCGRLADKV
ncbi:MAG: arginase family protein, partial [Nitrososphaerota archaeon]|nr:arginase family protein [Nitrososphaerota archaeon]